MYRSVSLLAMTPLCPLRGRRIGATDPESSQLEHWRRLQDVFQLLICTIPLAGFSSHVEASFAFVGYVLLEINVVPCLAKQG